MGELLGRKINMRSCGFIMLILSVFLLSGCKLSESYSVEKAQDNGDVISYKEGGKSENVIKLLEFIEKVNENEKSEVRIVHFDQSPPVIADLSYNEGLITYSETTNPSKAGREIECKEINDSEMGIFGLTGCQGDKENTGILFTSFYFYDKAKREITR